MFHELIQGSLCSRMVWAPKQKSFPKTTIPLVLFFAAISIGVPASAAAPAMGRFVSVDGPVTVWNPAGQKSLPVKKGKQVAEEQRIVTSGDGSACVSFFDGSLLTLRSGTELSVVQLKKSPAKDNVLKFKMAQGSLTAEVAKSDLVKTHFEIESGGVICGAKGTKFTMDYDLGSGKLNLRVSEGSVYADSGGNRIVLNAGEQTAFLKGKVVADKGTAKPGNQDDVSGKMAQLEFNDPALKELHNQFGLANRNYRDQAVNDPNAFGLKSKLSPNAAAGGGLIEAKP